MLVSEDTILKGREGWLAAIADDRFSCVGAKSAMARGTFKTLVCLSLVWRSWPPVRQAL